MGRTQSWRQTGAYLSGILATLLACGTGGGITTSSGPATSADALRTGDVILVYATENEQRHIYAVTRGKSVPAAWAGTNPFAEPAPEPRPQPAFATPPPPTDETLRNWDVVWSADGRYAAHTVERQANLAPLDWGATRPIYFFDGQTGQHDIIREDKVIRPERWSADGRYLFANIRTSFERWERATGEWTRLSNNTHTYLGHTPDGQQWLWRDSMNQLYLSDVNGEQLTPLAIPAGHHVSEHQKHLHWSPDGQMLAFQTFNFPRPYTYTIQIVNLPSGDVRQLYTQSGTTLAGGYTMTWSPDSQYIAFLGNGRCTSRADDITISGVQTLCDAEVFVIPVAEGEAQRATNTANSAVKIWKQGPIVWQIKE